MKSRKEVVDRIAELMGYELRESCACQGCRPYWRRGTDRVDIHPCPTSTEGLLNFIPIQYNITIKAKLCGGDGSVEGVPHGQYWHTQAYAIENNVAFDLAKSIGSNINYVGNRESAVYDAVARLVLEVLEKEKVKNGQETT